MADAKKKKKKKNLSLMKIARGPTITQLAKLKSEDGEPIEDQAEQLERWVEHYSELSVQDLPQHPGMEAVSSSFVCICRIS